VTAPWTPKVGEGATLCYWTDRYAGTVIAVSKNGRTVAVQQDTAKALHTMMTDSGQQWEHERDPQEAVTVLTRRKNGRYIAKGATMNGTPRLMQGRHHYFDYSF